ncbi:hypothetical protein C2869_06185 [Saccharobesus litoralis]|uniref:Uncharacterized protein n=1 Tax=Saccharobesus litoralis TaxID=2172099 RepID=A0A2S0VPD6_9ALTE|nr:hypothetical protein [Saccharobesus litoralis]AWB66052.1 hypothetical protein C2869_06185 [Saccharobesus litoralis]
MTTSILQSLTLEKRPEVKGGDQQLQAKRFKLVKRLELQLELVQYAMEGKPYIHIVTKRVKDPETGDKIEKKVQKRHKPWFYRCGDNHYFELRVSNRVVELKAGCPAIKVGTMSELQKVIINLIKAAELGELDKYFETKFKKVGK